MSKQQTNLLLTVDSPPADADLQILREGLSTFNVEQAAMDQGQRLAIFQRDQDGQVVGGIYAWLWGHCLEIFLLWIEEPLRGQGLGRQLLVQMEAAGRQRGARVAMLDTFSFQAPGFYSHHGYQTFGVIEGYGGGHAKHFMRKALA